MRTLVVFKTVDGNQNWVSDYGPAPFLAHPAVRPAFRPAFRPCRNYPYALL